MLVFLSGSKNLKLAAMIIAADWVVSNALYYFLSDSAVNVIAPMNIVVLGLFYTLWRSERLNGAFIHKIFFGYYCLYLVVNLWHLLGRFFFPETLTASYYFSLAASNGVFILIVATLWLFGVLKFLDNNAKGGLMGVYQRNIGTWRRWFGR
ncbi:hypothetical protein [Hyphococcus sp.]|uniref:hypothetical protein n=1 Tax=Hyphococcus sp. TaxID=2038636 RepID=UPI003CCC0B76